MLTRILRWLWERYGKKSELWLHRHGHWFGALAFIAALVFACLWLLQASRMASTVTAMLTHQREPVPETFPGLDGLILSKVDQDDLRDALPSDEAVAIAGTISSQMYSANPVIDHPRSRELKLRSFTSGSERPASSITQQFLVDDSESSALFIPAFTLPVKPEERNHLTDELVNEVVTRSGQLSNDIKSSDRVSDLLENFGGKHLFKGRPEVITQAYLITATGVTRMWQSNSKARATRDNFNPHRVFQDRPYFWPALENASSQPGPFSHISRPYFDVAGNGIVYTGCWGLPGTQSVSDSVLCIDSEKEISLESLLSDVIVGKPARFSCQNRPDGNHDCPIQLSAEYSSIRDSLINITSDLDRKHRFDELQGGLYVIAEKQNSVQRWASGLQFDGSSLIKAALLSDITSTFYFTIPIPRSGVAEDSATTEFNLYRIDIGKPHERLLLYALFTFVFGLAAAVCFYVLHRSRIYALQFMREVESVMAISPVAFCHLDECDHISSHNHAFRDLLGFQDDELKNTRLRDLVCLGDSQVHYDIITKCREKMLFTPAYEVQMKRRKGDCINIVISGSPLYMYPHEHGKGLNQRPHTFGILLQPSETKTFDYVPLHTREFEKAVENWHSFRTAASPG